MKKRSLSILLLLALLITCLPLSALAVSPTAVQLPNFHPVRTYTPFQDVKAGSWYETSVKTAVTYGILDGTGNGKYEPTGTLTIAQAIKIASCIHSINNTGSADFTNGSPWYQPYVDYAKAQGIVTKTYANYNAVASRLQVAEIFVAALPQSALPEANTIVPNGIPDVPSDSQGASQIYRLYRAGILQGGNSDHFYFPHSSIQRAEIATIVSRLIVPTQRLTFSIPTAFTLSTATLTVKNGNELLWNAVNSATGYEIAYKGASDTAFKTLTTVGTVTTYTLSSLAEGSYSVKIRPVAESGSSKVYGDYSNTVTAKVSFAGESAYTAARKQVKDYLGAGASQWNWGIFQYAYYDIDGNGTREMLVRNQNYPDDISAIYAYSGNHAVCLFVDDFSDMPQGNNEYYWGCSLLPNGVIYFHLDKEYYNAGGTLTSQIIGLDVCRIASDGASLKLLESAVYEYKSGGEAAYRSTVSSSRNFLGGNRANFSAIKMSVFDNLYYNFGSYGKAISITNMKWTSF